MAAGSQNQNGIYTIAPDGTQERLIAPLNSLESWGSEGIRGTHFDWGPVWSPDSNTLAYAVYGFGKSPGSEVLDISFQSTLYKVEPDGSGFKRLFADPEAYHDTKLQNLTWSPDGRKIAFSYSVATLNESSRRVWDTKLYVVGADGEGLNEIPGTGELLASSYVDGLEWSPDGAEILLGTRSQGIYSISIENFEIRKIAEGSGFAAWSPDSSRIALLSENPDAILTSMQRDGSDVRVLARADENGRLVPANPK